MGKILDKVVQDDAAPSRSDLWLDGETLKANIHGKWKSISGGGSGAGVTIVDSVDKLDENAPAGSMAVVAKEGNSTKAKFSELYQLDMNNDMEVDQVNMTITIKNKEKFDLISDIDIILPKDNKLISGQTSAILIGPFEIFNDIMMGGGDTSSVSAAIMIGAKSENDIITVVEGSLIHNGEELVVSLIENDGEKYVLNEKGIKEFKNFISNIDVFTYYICEINSLMGNTELPTYLDNFITFYKGQPSDSKVFIKKDKWKGICEDDFNDFDKKLNKKADVIGKSELLFAYSLKPNTYYTKELSRSNDLTITLLNYNESSNYDEYILELIIGDRAPSNLIIEDSNHTVLNIKWANNMAPTFSPYTTYIISISNIYAVFAQFTNE